MGLNGEDCISRLFQKIGVDMKREFFLGYSFNSYAYVKFPLDNAVMDMLRGKSKKPMIGFKLIPIVPTNITEIAKKLLDSKVPISKDSDKTLMLWLNQYLPNTLAKYGLTPAGATAAPPEEESLENLSLEQLQDREKLLELREQVRELEAKQGQLPAQTAPAQVELKPHWKIPTKPPFGYKHFLDSNAIEQMLKHQGVNVKHGGFKFGDHGYRIFVEEDGFTMDRGESPKEIQEACKSWDEKTVLDWVAPRIPRALKSAGLLD